LLNNIYIVYIYCFFSRLNVLYSVSSSSSSATICGIQYVDYTDEHINEDELTKRFLKRINPKQSVNIAKRIKVTIKARNEYH
jgi:hypothetical protein